MSKDNQPDPECDFALLCDYFSTLERQGPGSAEVTLRALGFIDHLPAAAQIADIGCGTGGQTRVLARQAPGQITGVDLFPVFIDLFNRRSRELGLQDRVQGVVGSMEALPFREGVLDLIWSEGAIYNLGFEHGLREWRRYLKPGGFVAVTDATWLADARPAEIEAFWNREYPEIDTIASRVRQVQSLGYLPVATFVLPETCWTENFYAPQVAAQERFLEKHPGDAAARELVAEQRREAELYARYKAFYGYVFYIGKKL